MSQYAVAKTDPLFGMLDMIGAPVFVVDRLPDGAFQLAYLNRFYRLNVGLDAEALTARPVAEIFPERTARLLAGNYMAALRKNGPLCYDELLLLDGNETWWRTSLSRAPGAEERLIGIAVEVTDMKEKEIRMAAEIANLDDSLAEVRTLSGLTAHDLRGPLGNVVSLSEIVLDGFQDLGDGKRGMIEACAQVARTSLKSISTLMARIGHDRPLTPILDTVDLGRVCAEVAALADPIGRLDIVHPHTVVESDHVVLQTALRNLVDNAVRYATSCIDITLAATAEDGMLTLVVSDDGPGFPEGVDPVERAVLPRIDSEPGGFGLGAVMRLLASRGGKLEHVACDAPGATLRVVIPGRIRTHAQAITA